MSAHPVNSNQWIVLSVLCECQTDSLDLPDPLSMKSSDYGVSHARSWMSGISVQPEIRYLIKQTTRGSASTYWAVLKKRLKNEGADQLLTNCKQLKLKADDGKRSMPSQSTIA